MEYATAPKVRIEYGLRGDQVKEVQQMLHDLGYDLGKSGVNGIFDSITLSAVKKFQGDFKVKADGVVGPDTMEYLKTAWVQKSLEKLGIDCGPVNGSYGPLTKRGILVFKIRYGSDLSGAITDELIESLKKEADKISTTQPYPIIPLRSVPATDGTLVIAKQDVTTSPPIRPTIGYVPPVAMATALSARAPFVPAQAAQDSSVKAPVTYTVSSDTTSYFKVFDQGPQMVNAVTEASKFTGVPTDVMLALVLGEHISLSLDLDRQIAWLYANKTDLFREGPGGEKGPTQMADIALKTVEPLMPENVRNGPKDVRYYMYATALYIKYTCDYHKIDLASLTDDDTKKIFYYWSAGVFAPRVSNKFSDTAFAIYGKIKDKELYTVVK